MIRFLAIDFNQSPIAAVLTRIHRERPIEIVSIGSLVANSDDGNADGSLSLQLEMPDGGFDRAFAVVNGGDVIYASVDLPFSDPKKLAQVVPIQLQDSLPFDVSECVLDTSVVTQAKTSGFKILAALTPASVVSAALESMSSAGIDPIHLSTHAAALVGLFTAAAPETKGLRAIVNIQTQLIALVVLLDGQPIFFREWRRNEDDLSQTVAELGATISAQEADSAHSCSAVYVLADREYVQLCKSLLRLPVKSLDLSELVENKTNADLSLDQVTWALGLAVSERNTLGAKKMRFDFRRGPFAYQRAWNSVWEALSFEMVYIVLAVLFGIGLVGTKWWASHSRLAAVESKIEHMLKTNLPNEQITKRREISQLEEMVADRENQLREMGSLASLSPLESLRELSTIISPEISLEIESLTIGFSRILLRGSVPELPTQGKIETALKNSTKKFCAVNVDPQGGENSSSRVKFVAEIEVCE